MDLHVTLIIFLYAHVNIMQTLKIFNVRLAFKVANANLKSIFPTVVILQQLTINSFYTKSTC